MKETTVFCSYMKRTRVAKFSEWMMKPVLIALILLIPEARAQTFKILHSFTATPPTAGNPPYNLNGTNNDGSRPTGELALVGNVLYGTTSYGGAFGDGTVFKINTDGSGFLVLYNATASVSAYGGFATVLGGAGILLSGNVLYGMAPTGGTWGSGAVFQAKTDGSGSTDLHDFLQLAPGTNEFGANFVTNADGATPRGLVLASNTLYGVTEVGGLGGNGTIFSITLPPSLSILQSKSTVVLSWATNSSGFSLQSTIDLASLSNWVTVPTSPVVVNGQNTISNSISGRQRFFRLSE